MGDALKQHATVRIFNALPVGELRAGTIRYLDLQARSPPLRDFDVAVLTRLLPPELETILLAENAIGFPGIQLLGSVLPSLPSLKSLDLHANGEVTPSIAAKLLHAMDVSGEHGLVNVWGLPIRADTLGFVTDVLENTVEHLPPQRVKVLHASSGFVLNLWGYEMEKKDCVAVAKAIEERGTVDILYLATVVGGRHGVQERSDSPSQGHDQRMQRGWTANPEKG